MPLRKTYFIPGVINPQEVLWKDEHAEVVDSDTIYGDSWVATSLNKSEVFACYRSRLSFLEMVDPLSGEVRPRFKPCLSRYAGDDELYYGG